MPYFNLFCSITLKISKFLLFNCKEWFNEVFHGHRSYKKNTLLISRKNFKADFFVCEITYRVSNMEIPYSKELLWLHFWCQAFLSIIFMVEKCVHFDIWNNRISLFERAPSMILLIFQIWI